MKKIFAALLLFTAIQSKAQLVINELSQGTSGNKEYIELVVKGVKTCTDTSADLRGWIFDDQSGWFGTSAISQGSYRFANVASWSKVPYGSIILIYNSGEKNDLITMPDDPTDANNDNVYIVPVNSAVIEINNSTPSSASGPSFSYPSTGFVAGGASWTPIAFNNNGDALVTVAPTALNVAYHSLTYGNISGGMVHVAGSGGQKVYYATGSQFASSAAWTVGNAPSDETPGAPNTAANSAWINGMKISTGGGGVTNTVFDTACIGTPYVFNSLPITTPGIYRDTFLTGGGCDSIVILNLFFRTPPARPVVNTPVVYCQNAVAVALTAFGQNLLWYTSLTGVGTAVAPVPNTAVAGSTVYYVSQTVKNCESIKDSITVTVHPTPSAPSVISPVLYCVNEPALPLTASGTNLTWYTTPTVAIGSQVAPVPVTNAGGTISWYVSRKENGCESPRSQIDVIVRDPKASFTVNKDTLCSTDTIRITNSSVGVNLTYTWDFSDGSTYSLQDPEHIYTVPGSYNVVLVITDDNGCKDTAQKTAYVYPIPSFEFSVSDSTVCAGEGIFITSTYSAGYLYAEWDFGDGNTINQAVNVQHSYEVGGTYTIKVKSRYKACPEQERERTVNVFDHPVVDIGPDTSICPGNNLYSINNAEYQSSYTYLWSTGSVEASILANEPGVYWLTASNSNCSTTDSIQIFKSCYLDIPNVFTPNGDGMNDYFFPRQLLSRGVTRFKMQIFNRWGQVIFETTNINGRGWDGEFNGVPQYGGVYIYLIEGTFTNDTAEKYQGNVTLLR